MKTKLCAIKSIVLKCFRLQNIQIPGYYYHVKSKTQEF